MGTPTITILFSANCENVPAPFYLHLLAPHLCDGGFDLLAFDFDEYFVIRAAGDSRNMPLVRGHDGICRTAHDHVRQANLLPDPHRIIRAVDRIPIPRYLIGDELHAVTRLWGWD